MNLKANESNGLECISVNYILVSAAQESGGHDEIGSLNYKAIGIFNTMSHASKKGEYCHRFTMMHLHGNHVWGFFYF